MSVGEVVQEDEVLPENKVVWRLFDARYDISKVTKVCEPVVSCEDVRKRHPESPWPTLQHSRSIMSSNSSLLLVAVEKSSNLFQNGGPCHMRMRQKPVCSQETQS